MGYMIALLLVTHFVADFLMQSREMGKKKSSEPAWLFKHLSIQYLVFFFALLPFVGPTAFTFALLNAAIHGVIDWNIWRLYKLSAHVRIQQDVDIDYAVEFLTTQKHDPSLKKRLYDQRVASWQYWEDHWFYTTIGLDQLLHGLTLVLLARMLL